MVTWATSLHMPLKTSLHVPLKPSLHMPLKTLLHMPPKTSLHVPLKTATASIACIKGSGRCIAGAKRVSWPLSHADARDAGRGGLEGRAYSTSNQYY